ncbi:MAG: hypothetical protein IJR07_10910 [Bacteroidaceae bacterium]|nr:hypothetical protein [Bacteroidaceae bacterium]
MEDKNEKRVLSIELDNELKKVSVTGKNSDEKVVIKQEISEDDLDVAAGTEKKYCSGHCVVVRHHHTFSCDFFSK